MSEQTNPFQHSELNPDQAFNYTLLLLVDARSFAYAVIENNQLLAYGANCAINELSSPQHLLSAAYKNVIIGLTGSGFTLVPQNLFSADRITDMARLLDVKQNEKVLAQVFDEQNYVVYKVAEQHLAAIEKFNNKKIVFAAKGLSKAITQSDTLNNTLYLNIADNKVEFLYFKHNALRFYNSFEYKTADDVVYFSALVTRELDMEPNHTTLTLSGKIDQGDGLFTHLSQFFSEVHINNIHLLELPAEISAHQILSLASLSLCGSSEAL